MTDTERPKWRVRYGQHLSCLAALRAAGSPGTGSGSGLRLQNQPSYGLTPSSRAKSYSPQSGASTNCKNRQPIGGSKSEATLSRLRPFVIASCLMLCLPGCFGKLKERVFPTPSVSATLEPLLKCNDQAMSECPGVDPSEIKAVAARLETEYPALVRLENAAEAIALGSLALEALDVCRTKHHAETVECIQEHQGKQKAIRQERNR